MDEIPDTQAEYGTPRPNRPKAIIVQEGFMNQWHARAEYRPGEGWSTLVFAFEKASVRPGLDRQFRPVEPSAEFLAQARKDDPEWLPATEH